jgi:NDP-sugar pyrophosphorylase family protein
MKIVILAAGKGNRMGELTKDTPKPLLKYKGETLLEHKLKNLPANTDEIILVINYFGDKIRKTLGDSYNGIPIKYVEQKEMLGTAHALAQCRDLLTGRFIVLMADDLYAKKDLERLAEIPNSDWGVLTFPDKPGVKAGKIVKSSDGLFVEIYEDFGGTSPYNLIYTGACILDSQVFEKDMIKIANGEYGLPQTFSQFAKEKKIRVLETYDWIRITKPEDLI